MPFMPTKADDVVTLKSPAPKLVFDHAEKSPLSKLSLKIKSDTSGVGEGFDVDVGVDVGAGVFVSVGVEVMVGVYVAVEVSVGVAVSVGVGDGPSVGV
jgi:hypothetical protein